MCSRYALYSMPEWIKKEYEIKGFEEDYNIAPFTERLILKENEGMKSKWGIKAAGMSVINARIESYNEKKIFSNSIGCIIPMNGFFEWKSKVPYYFYSEKMLFACGLLLKDGFVILTKEADGMVGNIHDRMPVFSEHPDDWIRGRKHYDIKLKCHQVTRKMNNVGYRGRDSIKKAVTLGSF
jgi:putative SOS response-associated peptidase YedK